MNEISLCLDLLVHAFDDYIVSTLEPATSLSLTYPELIVLKSNTTSSEVPMF